MQKSQMGHAYKIHKQDGVYFLTLTIVDWVDLFTRSSYKEIITNSLNYCVEEKGMEIYAYVLMTNHLHIIAAAKNNNLSDIIRDFKRYTSQKIIEQISSNRESRRNWLLPIFRSAASKHKRNTCYQIWTHDNHAEEVYSPAFTKSKINYIHKNPVKAGMVGRPEEYLFSSARDYAGDQGPVKVLKIELQLL